MKENIYRFIRCIVAIIQSEYLQSHKNNISKIIWQEHNILINCWIHGIAKYKLKMAQRFSTVTVTQTATTRS